MSVPCSCGCGRPEFDCKQLPGPERGRVLTREEVEEMVASTERITKRKAHPDSLIPFFVLARSHELLREANIEGHDALCALNDWLATTGHGQQLPAALRSKCGRAIVALYEELSGVRLDDGDHHE